MSVFFKNKEFIFKMHIPFIKYERRWFPSGLKKEIIKCFISQKKIEINNYLKNLTKNDKFRDYGTKTEICLFINDDFRDNVFNLEKFFWGNCFITLYDTHTSEPYGTYEIYPANNKMVNILKNKIVDKYLIPDIRELINST